MKGQETCKTLEIFNMFIIVITLDIGLPILFIQTNLNAWRVFVALTTFLALVSVILIGYLIAYHFYLSKLILF